MDSLIKLAATTISRITGLVTVFIWGSSENYKISLKAGSRGVAYRIQHSSRQQSPSSEFSGSVLPLGPRKCLCRPIQTLKPKTIYVWGVNGEQRRDVILEIFVLLLFFIFFFSCLVCEEVGKFVKLVQKMAEGEFYPRPLYSDSGLASSSDFHTKQVTINLPITYSSVLEVPQPQSLKCLVLLTFF